MRITFVLSKVNEGGGTRVVAEHAKRLRQRGHHVTVVWPRNPTIPFLQKARTWLRGDGWPGDPDSEPSHIDNLDIEHRKIPVNRPIADSDVPQADVVVATWWMTAEWVASFAPNKGAKAWFVQGYEVEQGFPADEVGQAWGLPLHKIVVSGWLANIARDTYGEAHVSLVPNSVDTKLFHASPRNKQPRPTIGLVYSATPCKGLDIALDAIQQAARRMPDLQVVGFGLKRPSKTLPLPSGAVYVESPPQDEIRRLYARCDAWLFCSRSDGFGLPILEAMACRTPVIATPAGAARELLAGGGGILVEPNNPQRVAEAIEWIVSQPDPDWQTISGRAYATATQYSWDDATDRFEGALREAVRRTREGELGVPSAKETAPSESP